MQRVVRIRHCTEPVATMDLLCRFTHTPRHYQHQMLYSVVVFECTAGCALTDWYLPSCAIGKG